MHFARPSFASLASASLLAVSLVACGVPSAAAIGEQEEQSSAVTTTRAAAAQPDAVLRDAVVAHLRADKGVYAQTRCRSSNAEPAIETIVFTDGSISIVWKAGMFGLETVGGRVEGGKFVTVVSHAGNEYDLDFTIGGRPATMRVRKADGAELELNGATVPFDCDML